jgi:hypothetical protein
MELSTRAEHVVRGWTRPDEFYGGRDRFADGYSHESTARKALEGTLANFGLQASPDLAAAVEKVAADVTLDGPARRIEAHEAALREHAAKVAEAADDLLAAVAATRPKLITAADPFRSQDAQTEVLRALTVWSITSAPKSGPQLEKAIDEAISSGDRGRIGALAQLVDALPASRAAVTADGFEAAMGSAMTKHRLREKIAAAVDGLRTPAQQAAAQRLADFEQWAASHLEAAEITKAMAKDGTLVRRLKEHVPLRAWTPVEQQRSAAAAAAAAAGGRFVHG